MATLLVPYPGTIKLGTKGRRVRPVKRALKAAHYGKGVTLNNVMARTAMEQLHHFQHDHGLPTGDYNRATHKKLAKHFDIAGAHTLARIVAEQAPSIAEKRRLLVVSAAMLGYANRGSIHYTQGGSRMVGVTGKIRPPLFPHYADCSSFATWCYFVAGAPDPNGYRPGYPGWGYTGTLGKNGRVVSASQAKPGDLVLYGSGMPWHHVAIYVGNGRVVSHGSESGPALLPIDYRSDRGEIRSYL